MYPIISYSWVVLSEAVAYKVADKTLIQDKETGIPNNIVSFFSDSPLKGGEELDKIKFIINDQEETVKFKRKKDGRHKIILKDPSNILNVSQLTIGRDEIWFERDINKSHLFHVYTRCMGSVRSIVPNQKNIVGSDSFYNSTQRIGQQYFRKNVIDVCHGKCVVTSVKELQTSILVASHIKPWINSTATEKVQGGNGLLLSPHIDKLFDTGLITFDDNKKIIMSPLLAKEVINAWSIDNNKQYQLTKEQQHFMIFHQENVFKQ